MGSGAVAKAFADICLDILAWTAGSEPRFAALKAQAAAKYTDNIHSMAPPAASAQAQEASVAAEIACVLTIGPRAASVLLSESHELTTRGCPAGEMPASRFRHKARIWRERHHTESIEKRHAKGVLDRRV